MIVPNTDVFVHGRHHFQLVSVAHFCTCKRDSQLLKRQLQAQIAHQRAYSTTAQIALTQVFSGGQIQNLVTVYFVA